MLTRAHTLALSLSHFPDNSRTSSPLVNLQHKYTQTAATADRNWDLERVAENQKRSKSIGEFSHCFHFFIFHLITMHLEQTRFEQHAALMIYSY